MSEITITEFNDELVNVFDDMDQTVYINAVTATENRLVSITIKYKDDYYDIDCFWDLFHFVTFLRSTFNGNLNVELGC